MDQRQEGERGKADSQTDSTAVGPPHGGDTRAAIGIPGRPSPDKPGHPYESPQWKVPSPYSPLPPGPCFRTLRILSKSGLGGSVGKGGGDKILPGSFKSFGIFTRVHVIFK